MKCIIFVFLFLCSMFSTTYAGETSVSPDTIKSINGIVFGEELKLNKGFTINPEFTEGEFLHDYCLPKDFNLFNQRVNKIWYLSTQTHKFFGIESFYDSRQTFIYYKDLFTTKFGKPTEFGYVDGKVILVWSGKCIYMELGWEMDEAQEHGRGWLTIKKDSIYEDEYHEYLSKQKIE